MRKNELQTFQNLSEKITHSCVPRIVLCPPLEQKFLMMKSEQRFFLLISQIRVLIY